MQNINSITIAGRLGREVKVIHEDEDPKKTMASFTVAVNVYDPKAEKKERAVWIDVVAFGYQARTAIDQLDKGSRVAVEGSMDSRSWADKETGQKRSMLQIRASRIHIQDWKPDGKPDGRSRGEKRQQEENYGEETSDSMHPKDSGFDLD